MFLLISLGTLGLAAVKVVVEVSEEVLVTAAIKESPGTTILAMVAKAAMLVVGGGVMVGNGKIMGGGPVGGAAATEANKATEVGVYTKTLR